VRGAPQRPYYLGLAMSLRFADLPGKDLAKELEAAKPPLQAEVCCRPAMMHVTPSASDEDTRTRWPYHNSSSRRDTSTRRGGRPTEAAATNPIASLCTRSLFLACSQKSRPSFPSRWSSVLWDRRMSRSLSWSSSQSLFSLQPWYVLRVHREQRLCQAACRRSTRRTHEANVPPCAEQMYYNGSIRQAEGGKLSSFVTEQQAQVRAGAEEERGQVEKRNRRRGVE
jgi:hypothetical protein